MHQRARTSKGSNEAIGKVALATPCGCCLKIEANLPPTRATLRKRSLRSALRAYFLAHLMRAVSFVKDYSVQCESTENCLYVECLS